MANQLLIIPQRVALVDNRGLITTEWYRFLQTLWERSGGIPGNGIVDITESELTAASTEQIDVNAAANDLYQAPSIDQISLASESDISQSLNIEQFQEQLMIETIHQLVNEVAELRKEIDSLKQGTSL